MKINRNDPCTCGSGKKYKKCCGKENATELNANLIRQELNTVQNQIMQFSVDRFSSELQILMADFQAEMEDVEDLKETLTNLYLSWVMIYSPIKEEKTALQWYVEKNGNKLKRQKTRDLLSTWGQNPPSVFKVGEPITSEVSTVTDVFTNETYNVLFEEDSTPDEDSLVLGLPILTGDYYEFFLVTFIVQPQLEEKFMSEVDVETFKANPEALKESFPEVIKLTAGLYNTVDASERISWQDDKQKEVLDLFLKSEGMNEITEEEEETATFFWYLYCKRQEPTIRKPEIYAGALEYTLRSHLNEWTPISQKDAAAQYGTSGTSISAKYRDMTTALSDVIDEAHETLQEAAQ
ncbi:SEC-C domain-containing protein [Pontibacillus sp. ALD_SL1]|uniref:SEC-C metal-binding domain-containing protein n=1 Tax=Pontibacillus sp. ALD_SL1 TaxID=2777185 RepID=UPI001A96248A|nr:SEC-C metal-binding domain-containing protein [Pontibacillus sp. ALD_SL1]QSS99645.1 SEC-C domain-containing protein [Pontibacillus sp. ALD_SL1]